MIKVQSKKAIGLIYAIIIVVTIGTMGTYILDFSTRNAAQTAANTVRMKISLYMRSTVEYILFLTSLHKSYSNIHSCNIAGAKKDCNPTTGIPSTLSSSRPYMNVDYRNEIPLFLEFNYGNNNEYKFKVLISETSTQNSKEMNGSIVIDIIGTFIGIEDDPTDDVIVTRRIVEKV